MNLLKDLRQRLFNGWNGCSNHGCVVTGRKKGMGTNGSCHCLTDAPRSRLNILSQRLQAIITEAEKERTGDLEEIFIRVAKVASEYDIAGNLIWSDDLEVGITCNDVFHWGCADVEDINSDEDIELLIQACKDSEFDGPTLYCARKRGMRPQGAMYKHLDEKDWPLFDECGPHRETGIGNPVEQPERK